MIPSRKPNPFRKNDALANTVSDVLNKSAQQKQNDIPDTVKDAARAAGTELRGMGRQPLETRTSVYNKHLTKAVGDSAVSPSIRTSFETMADQEFNTPVE